MRGMEAVFENLKSITKEMLNDCETVACERKSCVENRYRACPRWTARRCISFFTGNIGRDLSGYVWYDWR